MKRSNEKNTHIQPVVIIGWTLLVLLVVGGGFFGYRYLETQEREKAVEETARSFVDAFQKKDYEKLSELLESKSLKKEETTSEEVSQRYATIYEGVGLTSVKTLDFQVNETEEKEMYKASFVAEMDSVFGPLPEQNYSFDLLVRDKEVYVEWNPNLIFPSMEKGDTVNIKKVSGKRGSLLDRNGDLLAGEGDALQAGLHPSALGEGETRTSALEEISDAFGISSDKLEDLLAQSWVTDESFVPFVIRDEGDTPQLTGVLYQETQARLYPLKEAAAHIIGYTGEATAEDIEKNSDIKQGEQIGKTGLEAALNNRLQATPGGILSIVDKDGEIREELLKTEAKDGETIALTLDRTLQEEAYKTLNEEAGSAVVLAPKTGELLVLASSPSYDPVKMSRGISTSDYQVYADDTRSPFLARFSSQYAPASTFKVLTAAIGLDAGTLDPTEKRLIQGFKWTKDGSWGSDAVTRVSEKVSEVDLRTALIYSDNIYFAQEALDMGTETFLKGLDAFPFGEKTSLPIAMKPAQYATEGKIQSEKQLADTAYGQGQILMSPLQQAWFYSVIANEGKLATPLLLKDEADQTEQDYSMPISKEASNTVKGIMREVVTDPNGTAHQLASLPGAIGAKTGTSEVNAAESQEKENNGFVLALDVENSNFLLLSVLERASGGETVNAFKTYIQRVYDARSE